ncbi:hypothetical protein ACOSQ3_004819 [Xanthoceras sorbifolium]
MRSRVRGVGKASLQIACQQRGSKSPSPRLRPRPGIQYFDCCSQDYGPNSDATLKASFGITRSTSFPTRLGDEREYSRRVAKGIVYLSPSLGERFPHSSNS